MIFVNFALEKRLTFGNVNRLTFKLHYNTDFPEGYKWAQGWKDKSASVVQVKDCLWRSPLVQWQVQTVQFCLTVLPRLSTQQTLNK